MFTLRQTRVAGLVTSVCLVFSTGWAFASGDFDLRKLSHDLDGWSVLDYTISGNGKWIVYRANDYGSGGLDALYSVPTSGGPPVMLAAQNGGAAKSFSEYEISPDSSRVIWRGDLKTDKVIELYSRPIDGSSAAVKLNHALDGWAVLDFEVSSDGGWVVYRSNDYGAGGLDALYSVPAGGGAKPTMLAAQTGGAARSFREYAITPDGTRVVWRGDLISDDVIELFSRPIDGGETAVKLNHSLGGWAVLEYQISDDGLWVVYRTNDYGSGLEALYSVPSDGSTLANMLVYQTGGAVHAIEEYRIDRQSRRVFWRGDLETDGVFELFSRPIDARALAAKLNHDLGGWSVLDFEVSNDASVVVYRADDFGAGGLDALYSASAQGLWGPIVLAQQNGGAAKAIHEYEITGDSKRIVWRGDLETDGVDELFGRSVYLLGDTVRLNHDLGEWSVLDFQISRDGTFIVYRSDDFGNIGLEALYMVPATGDAEPEMLVAQTHGAARAVDEYTIGPTSGRLIVLGDLDTDGVFELFIIDFHLFLCDFESGDFSSWSGLVM